MELERVNIKIHLDDESRRVLKKIKNCHLKRIGYIFEFHSSDATVLEFEDWCVKVSNELIVIREPKFVDEMCELKLREEHVIDDIAYISADGTAEKYEYRDYDMQISSIDVIRDYAACDDPSRGRSLVYDFEIMVILRSADRELMLFAYNPGTQTINMYESTADLDDWMSIENLWQESDQDDNPLEMEFKRTIEHL